LKVSEYFPTIDPLENSADKEIKKRKNDIAKLPVAFKHRQHTSPSSNR